MLPCSQCNMWFSVDDLFSHIKDKHKYTDEFICPVCPKSFGRFSSYKTHVVSCNNNTPDRLRAYLLDPELHELIVGRYRNGELDNFEDDMNKSTLELACKLCANMNFAR